MKRAYHGDWMDALPSRFINEIPDESVEKNEIGVNDNDDFEFNQDNSIEFNEEYRSPGWDRYKKKIKCLNGKNKKIKKKFLKRKKLDGYIVPKNDKFFGEYIPEHNDKLKFISNFSGSYGFALILKDKNYLFVDGRYTLQAANQSGNFFKIITIPNKMPSDIFLKKKKYQLVLIIIYLLKKNLSLFFSKTKCKFIPIDEDLIDKIWKRKKEINKKKFFFAT